MIYLQCKFNEKNIPFLNMASTNPAFLLTEKLNSTNIPPSTWYYNCFENGALLTEGSDSTFFYHTACPLT